MTTNTSWGLYAALELRPWRVAPEGEKVMAGCPGCELLPEPIPAVGQLLIWPPLGHTSQKIRESLRQLGAEISEPAQQCLEVDISTGLLAWIRDQWPKLLSQAEAADCRCLILPPGTAVSLEHFGQMTTLETLLGRISGRWLVEMIAEQRLLTHFQPIVSVMSGARPRRSRRTDFAIGAL